MRDFLAPLTGETVLITGADGMLGRAFQEVLRRAAVACRCIPLCHPKLDVTDRRAVLECTRSRPTLILHCAAESSADKCESYPNHCWKTQVVGTENVVQLARATGARLFFPQSFLIFGGEAPFVTEDDSPNPLSTYGRCKLEAEKLIRTALPDALIVRMGGFFGGDLKDKNFVGKFTRQLLALCTSGTKQCEVGDRVWQPSYTLDLAENILALLSAGRGGVYNMASSGHATFLDVARECVQTVGLSHLIQLTPAARPFQELALRPKSVVMATHRLDREQMNFQRDWKTALGEYLARPYFDFLRTVAQRGDGS
jgi:dTDP-4-dehydrorhamnose reductase